MQESAQQQSSHMDRLTQTQNSIDELIQIMYSTLSYLTRKANFKQVNPDFPITQIIPSADSPQVFEANQKELVGDFLRKAKQLEYLISVLPSSVEEEENVTEFEELEKEMNRVNQEYLDVIKEARELNVQLTSTLRTTLDARATLLPS